MKLIYDGLGRVLKRTVNGIATIFVYDSWKAIEELDASGNVLAWNVYGAGPDEIHWRNQRGTTLIYHTDKEGNVMFLLDASGAGIERYTYDAFGAAKITDWVGNARSVSASGNRFMFNGKDYVAEIGLYDYRHRWYQPQLGRFLQVDPKGFDAGDENLFRYCMDDPVDKTDPDGMFGTPPEQSITGSQINAADRMDVINLAGETSLQGNAAAAALGAASSKRDTGYTVAWQGTMKMAEAMGLTPIARDRKLQSRSPRELAIEAAMQANADSKGDLLYSYNVYKRNGAVIYVRSAGAHENGYSDQEYISKPAQGDVFIANGHVHPARIADNSHRWTSHSPTDQNLSFGRLKYFSGTGPVTFLKGRNRVSRV